MLVIFIAVATFVFVRLSGKQKGLQSPEKYDELEFVVVHRPQITYFVDVKYNLCFATRKPNYQDLVEFQCSDRLRWDVELNLGKKPVDKVK